MQYKLKIILSIILFLGASIFAQTTIAVIDLEGIGISKDETNLLTNRLRNELVKTKAFRVVERQEMSKILKEQKFQASGCTSTECAVEIGQLLGVERIVMGSIGKIGNIFTVSSRIVDVESAELTSVSDYDYEGSITELLKNGMKNVALELVGERKVEVISPQRELKTENLDISSENGTLFWIPDSNSFWYIPDSSVDRFRKDYPKSEEASLFRNINTGDEKALSSTKLKDAATLLPGCDLVVPEVIQNINYNLKEQAFVTITIYDIVGRKVAQLVNSVQEAGFKSVQWDATDSSGNPVSAGVYTYKLNVGENVQATKSFILTRETKTN
jgi:TolB-like protein